MKRKLKFNAICLTMCLLRVIQSNILRVASTILRQNNQLLWMLSTDSYLPFCVYSVGFNVVPPTSF